MMEDWEGSPPFSEGTAWLPFAEGLGCWDGGGVVEGFALPELLCDKGHERMKQPVAKKGP